jgi:hypothetical protein
MERKYYTIAEGSDLKAKVADFIAEMKTVKKVWADFALKHGAVDQWKRGSFIIGLAFDGLPPKGWIARKNMPDGCCTPNLKTKEGKEFNKELNKLPRQLRASDFSDLIGFDSTTGTEGRGVAIYYATFEQLGEDIIVTLPENGEPVAGLIPMKKSDYWKRKEQAPSMQDPTGGKE